MFRGISLWRARGCLGLTYREVEQASYEHYGYLGQDHQWMEPILRPGALVLVDPQRQRIEAGGWRNEAERPIDLVDIRGGYHCCWCLIEKGRLIFQPHPFSTRVPEAYRFPDEAEVMGQVVGVSMRLVAD